MVRRRLGGADIHMAVHLPAVGAYDFGLEEVGYSQGEIGLADCGGADEGEETRAGGVFSH